MIYPLTHSHITVPDAPWCWNIDLQNYAIVGVNVGTYSSTMEHLGPENRGNKWKTLGHILGAYLVAVRSLCRWRCENIGDW